MAEVVISGALSLVLSLDEQRKNRKEKESTRKTVNEVNLLWGNEQISYGVAKKQIFITQDLCNKK